MHKKKNFCESKTLDAKSKAMLAAPRDSIGFKSLMTKTVFSSDVIFGFPLIPGATAIKVKESRQANAYKVAIFVVHMGTLLLVKILFLMLDSKSGPWSELFSTGAEDTWTRDLSEEDSFIRYVSTGRDYISKLFPKRMLNSRLNPVVWPIVEASNFSRRSNFEASMKGRILHINTPERWSSISIKTLAALNFCLDNFDFDYLVRGNATSFFNVEVLRNYLKISQTNYLGPVHKNKPFASGWAIVMSRRATTYLVQNFSFSALRYFDDEAFGKVLTPIFGCDTLPYLEISSLQNLRSYSGEILCSAPAIRTKSLVDGHRMDSVIQQNIYKKTRDRK